MTLPKDRLRKIHGIGEQTGSADQAVLARRKYHEAAARWLAKWLPPLQAFFALLGFFVILLPVLSKPWRSIVEALPIFAKIFHDYSTFSGLAMVHFYISMALFLVRGWQIRSLPGGNAFPLTYRNVVDMELVPRTRTEECAYWIDISFGFVGATLLLFLPFGVLAYFINIGS